MSAPASQTGDVIAALQHRAKWPLMLADMADVLVGLFKRRGRPEGEAVSDAQAVVLELSRFHGGRQWYLPAAKQLRVALRDDELFRAFTGNNHDELAERFGVTERTVYAVIARQYELRRQRAHRPQAPR